MKSILAGFLNPVKLFRAYKYKRKCGRYHKPAHDLELRLYHRMLSKDMLHWGYFDEPGTPAEEISVSDFEQAEVRYAEILSGLIGEPGQLVLDVGCGMGGIATMLREKGHRVELLSPNTGQKEYLMQTRPQMPFHHVKYERFRSAGTYDAVLNAESLQYIPLEQAFDKTADILRPGGRWVIADYFRLHERGKSRSGHLLDAFMRMVPEKGWNIASQRDITQNVLPTIKLANMYAGRFLMPLLDFAFAKFHYKQPFLYYMLKGLEEKARKKADRELASINPELFVADKRYMLFVLERSR